MAIVNLELKKKNILSRLDVFPELEDLEDGLHNIVKIIKDMKVSKKGEDYYFSIFKKLIEEKIISPSNFYDVIVLEQFDNQNYSFKAILSVIKPAKMGDCYKFSVSRKFISSKVVRRFLDYSLVIIERKK